jgi:hypothetical protein
MRRVYSVRVLKRRQEVEAEVVLGDERVDADVVRDDHRVQPLTLVEVCERLRGLANDRLQAAS